MSKSTFRLQTLLRLRENYRDELRARLAEAIHAAELLSGRRHDVAEELSELQTCQRTTLAEEKTNINRLVDGQRYLLTLRAQEGTMTQQSNLLEAEIERRRQAVVEADQQVRVLDKLRERQATDAREQQMREETKTYDETASIHHHRRESWVPS